MHSVINVLACLPVLCQSWLWSYLAVPPEPQRLYRVMCGLLHNTAVRADLQIPHGDQVSCTIVAWSYLPSSCNISLVAYAV